MLVFGCLVGLSGAALLVGAALMVHLALNFGE